MNKPTLLLSIFSVSILFLMVHPVAIFAQSAGNEGIVEDEVIAIGVRQNDNAMAAFLNGDFETAEIEFDKNATCARRAEREFVAGVEAARDSTLRVDAAAESNNAPSPTGGPGGAAPAPSAQASVPQAQLNSRTTKTRESVQDRTCDDIGFQYYMRGLSQIKLGKFQDAKESLTSAVFHRKDIYDAYFRLALLEYQDQDMSAARRNFNALKRAEKKCRQCEAKDDITQKVSYLENLLN